MGRRMLTKKNRKKFQANPNRCEYHPNRPAVVGVKKGDKILFWLCGDCKAEITKSA